jgi:Alpha/beta hydrolase family
VEFNLERDMEVLHGGRPQVVVYAHGFGVQRDSLGMFRDLAHGLPDTYTSVLVDMNYVSGTTVTLRTLTEQAEVLAQTVAEARRKRPEAQIHLVAHSMGCIVAAMLGDTDLGQVVFLAPPTKTSGGRSREKYMNYPGAVLEGRVLTVPRRDGTTTVIDLDYFDDLESRNPAQIILDYAGRHPLTVVEALEEDVIKNANYGVFEGQPGIELLAIHGDHNFTGEYREGLIGVVSSLLEAGSL